MELTGFCTVKALNPLALLQANRVGFGRISTEISSELHSICLESIECVNEFDGTRGQIMNIKDILIFIVNYIII